MSQARKGLGRGLAALIPTDDMNFLSRVARGEVEPQIIVPPAEPVVPSTSGKATKSTSKTKKEAHLSSFPTDSARSSTLSPSENSADVQSSGASSKSHSKKAAREASVSTTGAAESTGGHQGDNEVRWLAPADVSPNPYQPRRHFDSAELENLAASIREHGVLQPILVRPLNFNSAAADLRFQLVAGERRWRAAQAAGVTTIPAIVRAVDDQQALELAVIENVQRHDISPLDAALAYRRLANEFGLSQEKISQRVGKSRSAVANTMRLLELPDEVQQALNEGMLSEGHGRAILLATGEGARRAAFRAILRDKLSVREAEELARRTMRSESSDVRKGAGAAGETEAASKTDTARPSFNGTDWLIIVEELQRSLGGQVSLRPRRKGGQITINCATREQMDTVIERLRAR